MEFLEYYRKRQPEMLRLLKNLVELESPSDDKTAVDRCADFVLKNLKSTGVKLRSYPQSEIGDLHLADYLTESKDPEKILILCHLDTVWPLGTLLEMPFRIERDKAYGPGVLDMKAGVVMIIEALKAISALSRRPRKQIQIFLDSYEEKGHAVVYRILEELGRSAAAILCLEPAISGGALKLRRKGRLVVRVQAFGKAAHAGNPRAGINAIDELMHQLRTIYRLRSQSISINTGKITGGETANVVAPRAEALLDIRLWKEAQSQHVKTALANLYPHFPGSRLHTTIEQEVPALDHSPGSAALYRKTVRIARQIGLELKGGKTGGGSDASIAAQGGIPVLDGLGPDGDGIHAEHEHMLIPSLIERTALLTELLLRL
jgi:glutamate carboxypeptidase